MKDNLESAWPSWPTRTTEGVKRLSQTSWRKSSYSGTSGSDCVEVAWRSPQVLVRDSKNPAGPTLTLAYTAWRELLTTLP
ncbi:DUF397 domain-containing protein [Kibdelosporangium banguiense]|uniref:DUF397 domain-containing protein n=1 Tax=Kibdelosporangium banguiense TaxID=1365924 RepID=UPI001AEA04E8|nr:DUF397 domain-containing protein [Kibdelosporangium banguiense]